MHPDTYILDVNRNPVAEPNLERRREWFARHKNRLVRRSYITKDIYVSTAFLGIDYNPSGRGPPVLWETMVFGGPHDGYQRRYGSRAAMPAAIPANVTPSATKEASGASHVS
jgi:hypothetical protein